MNSWRNEIDLLGFAAIPCFFDQEEIDVFLNALSEVPTSDGIRKKANVYAIRNLLECIPAIRGLAHSDRLQALVNSVLGKQAFPVRATLFDKTPEANWLVPWHQDLTICVKKRFDVPGFGRWSVKAGVQHVQPPVKILEGMLAVRVHLDDCGSHNGALRVLPATHRMGRLTAQQIALAQANAVPVTCAVTRGGLVLMKPLALHASSAAEVPAHRRVIHIDYASCALPAALEWFAE